jgi:signal transduction histidine kinase
MSPLFSDLDVPTAFRFVGLIWIVLGLLMLIVHRGLGRPSVQRWIEGSVLIGVGLVLLSIRPSLPVLVGYHLAQTCLSGGLLLLSYSLFQESRPGTTFSRNWNVGLASLFAVYIIGFYAQVSLATSLPFRLSYVAAFQSFTALTFLAGAITLHLRYRTSGSFVLLFSSMFFAVLLIARVWGLFYSGGDLNTEIKDPTQILTFYSGLVATLLAPIGLSLFHADRLLNEASIKRNTRSDGSGERQGGSGGQLLTFREVIRERNDLLVSIERSARLNAVGMYSAAMAHELRQPLTVMGLDAGFLERQIRKEGIDSPEILESVKNLLGEQKRAASILSALRELYLEGPETRVTLDLPQLVGHTVGMVRTLPETRGIELAEFGLEQSIELLAHPIQLQQVVFNLLTNALAATERARGDRIEVIVRRDGNFGVVEIRDSGPGLPPNLLDGEDPSTPATDSEGMGLGLTIAKTIVGRHGGTMYGESLSGGGARIEVRLPLTPIPILGAEGTRPLMPSPEPQPVTPV